jgi:hypothetical protein
MPILLYFDYFIVRKIHQITRISAVAKMAGSEQRFTKDGEHQFMGDCNTLDMELMT